MKRSEMVDNIVSILRGCYPQYLDSQSNYSVRIDAEYVLDALEEAGMLPPSTPYKDLEGNILCIYSNKWEPEDE